MPAPDSREELWRRLAELCDQMDARGIGSFSDRQLEDLGRLYRASTTHLALLRSFGASARALEKLNRLVSRAHAILYGRSPRGRGPGWLATVGAIPSAVRHTFRYHLVALACLMVGGLYGFFGSAANPEWSLELVAVGDERTVYADRQELLDSLMQGRPGTSQQSAGSSEREFGQGQKAVFAAFLWQNNTKVALLAFFSGFLFGLPTVLLLVFNGALLGAYTWTFHKNDLAYEWWAWILPHGITELGAIILLGGGGLWIGRMMLAPGPHGRLGGMRQARPTILRLLLLAFPMLGLAALFESYVRQSGMSEPGRYVFAAATAVLWAVIFGLGRARTPRVSHRAQTVAQRAVPLPEDEELLGSLGPGPS
jgi:uncharacterized membrane protein SpoIIM required for sporulation